MSRRLLASLTVVPLLAAASVIAVHAAQTQHGPAPAPAGFALKDGAGKELVEAMCVGCHAPNYIPNSGGYSRDHWRQLVLSMIDLNGRPQLDQIVNYLATNYPETDARKPTPVQGPLQVTFQSWKVPTLGQMPRDPVQAADGSIWWVAQWPSGNLVGRLDPNTGAMKEYPLPAGTLPHSVTPDPDGKTMWVSGNGNGTLVKVDAATGAMQVIKMPDANAKDPHTMVFDRNGVMYFTVQLSNMVGRFNPKTGDIKVVKVARENSRPYAIKIATDGGVWFNCRNAPCVFRMDPASMEMKEFKLPHAETWSRRLVLADDDTVWYGDTGRGYIGRVDPKTGAVKEWAMPSGPRSEPYAIEWLNGAVWLNESGKRPDTLVRFDPQTEKFQSWVIPSAQGFHGGIVRHMRKTREGNLLMHQGSSNNIILAKIGPQRQAAAR